MSRRLRLWHTALVVLTGSTLAAPAFAQARVDSKPRLIVFITVDQMRSDYVDRWAGQLTGGLARCRAARRSALAWRGLWRRSRVFCSSMSR